MNTLPTELRHLLLDLLATRRELNPSRIAALEQDDWEHLATMVRQHRLGPMLHWRLQRNHPETPVPEAFSDKLSTEFKRSVRCSLYIQRQMVHIHRLLQQATIPHAFLKGAFLAYHSYPNPGLRPLRDLDILVPTEQAITAHQALRDAGLVYKNPYRGNLKDALQLGKHLPPLLTPDDRICIELHGKLFSPQAMSSGQTELTQQSGLWHRIIHRDTANTPIPFLSTTDQLLHLIVHSAYDHLFDNGPLILCDIHYLLQRHTIDWPLFWRLAQQTGHARGCLLLLKMTERHHGKQPISWPETDQHQPVVRQSLIDTATMLTLTQRDPRTKSALQLRMNMASRRNSGKLEAIINKLFPPKAIISAQYPASQNSPRIYLYYLVRWYRLAAEGLPQYFTLSRSQQSWHELHELTLCRQWLTEEGEKQRITKEDAG